MNFALIKERKNPPDRRVVFSPAKLAEMRESYPQAGFFVESSDIRIFKDKEYEERGFAVTEDFSQADVLLGVKEVPIHALIAEKSYFFFSHTIKKQPYNRDLLAAILEKNITLYDHEVIIKENGARLIGFGRYAGLVGAYNGFRALGMRDGSFDLPKAEHLTDLKAMLDQLDKIRTHLPSIKIIVTGSGKVAKGIREILEHMEIHEVTPKEFLQLQHFNSDQPLFTHLDVLDYARKKNGASSTRYEFYNAPEKFESSFIPFAQTGDMLITGHFHGDGAPYFFTREDAKDPQFKIRLVADVSCDIDGPIASTIRPSTIEDPIYGYDPQTEQECDFRNENAITVMAVDNLPCELPKDASEGFGDMFAEHVMPAFFNGDKDGVLYRARMTEGGKLTERYRYLQDFVDGK